MTKQEKNNLLKIYHKAEQVLEIIEEWPDVLAKDCDDGFTHNAMALSAWFGLIHKDLKESVESGVLYAAD